MNGEGTMRIDAMWRHPGLMPSGKATDDRNFVEGARWRIRGGSDRPATGRRVKSLFHSLDMAPRAGYRLRGGSGVRMQASILHKKD